MFPAAQESARSSFRPRERDAAASGSDEGGTRHPRSAGPRRPTQRPSVPPQPRAAPQPSARARPSALPSRRPAVACADVIWAARPRLAAAASPDRERTGTRAGRGARRPRPQARAGQRAPDHMTRGPATRLINRAVCRGPNSGLSGPGRPALPPSGPPPLASPRAGAPRPGTRSAAQSRERGSRPPSGLRLRCRPQWDLLHSRRPWARPRSPPPARTPVPRPGRPAHARGLGT